MKEMLAKYSSAVLTYTKKCIPFSIFSESRYFYIKGGIEMVFWNSNYSVQAHSEAREL